MTWPRGVPPVHVTVECDGGQFHTISWRRGALVLEAHDAAADEAIVALGGDRPPCLEVRRSWRLGYIEEEPPAPAAGLVRSLSSVARWMSGGAPRPVVLPERLRRLREASVLHTWGRGLRDRTAGTETQAAFLDRAIARRVRELVAGRGPSGVDVEVVVADAVEVEGTRLAVTRDWLTRVWVQGRELAAPDGVVLALDGGEGEPAVVRWAHDGDDWLLVVSD
jgi:hypothetical protein